MKIQNLPSLNYFTILAEPFIFDCLTIFTTLAFLLQSFYESIFHKTERNSLKMSSRCFLFSARRKGVLNVIQMSRIKMSFNWTRKYQNCFTYWLTNKHIDSENITAAKQKHQRNFATNLNLLSAIKIPAVVFDFRGSEEARQLACVNE